MNTWAMSVKWAEIAGGTFDPLALSGPAFTRKRQALLSALHGCKLPISKCGVTRLVDDLVTAYGVSRDQCYAMMLSDVRNHIQREVMQAERNAEPSQPVYVDTETAYGVTQRMQRSIRVF